MKTTSTTWQTARTALTTVWNHKILWFFGFFVAAGGSGGFQASTDEGAGAAGATGALQSLPTWAFALIGVGLLLGLAALVLNIVSEAALIEGVRDSRQGARPTLKQGLRQGWRHFGSLLGLKLLTALAFLAGIAVIAVAPVLGALEVLPVGLALALGLPLLLVGVPYFLTVYFLYQWAMRFLVLEDRTAGEALREARRYLPGRLRESLELMLVGMLGQLGAGLAIVVALIPAALVGGLVYLAAGLIPAAIVGGLVVLPVGLAASGAGGAFRSSIWTLHFLGQEQSA
ncbi:MAG: hypothetical protein P1V51_02195 [Deltaproteobacteria bacterium]|nr:hypothetical protein [Deltaproteobacteria bacterium]